MPRYVVLFGSSYGLSRKQLDDLNYYIKGMLLSEVSAFVSTKFRNALVLMVEQKARVFNYDFTLANSLESKPTHFFCKPMVFDMRVCLALFT